MLNKGLIGKAGIGAGADAEVIHANPTGIVRAFVGSVWGWEHWRKIDGIYQQIDEWFDHNIMTDEGLTYMFDSAFSGGTQITAFYLVTYEDNHTPAAGDTYATPGFTECTAIDETTRPAWSEAGVASKILTNSASKATFTYNATKTIYGAALVGGGSAPTTKDDTAGGGTLVCEVGFTSGSKPVVNTDILKVTVTMTASDVP